MKITNMTLGIRTLSNSDGRRFLRMSLKSDAFEDKVFSQIPIDDHEDDFLSVYDVMVECLKRSLKKEIEAQEGK
jgi:hypothetical protein